MFTPHNKDILCIWFDMESFYAQAELSRRPDLVELEESGEKYVAVANTTSGLGYVYALSVNAKQNLGLGKGIRLHQIQNHPQIEIVPPDLDYYHALSDVLFGKIDEPLKKGGFLPKNEFVDDFSVHLVGKVEEAKHLAKRVKDFYDEMGFNLRYGISVNRTYSWMASRFAKEGKGDFLHPSYIKHHIWPLPLVDTTGDEPFYNFPSVSEKTVDKLHKLNPPILTIGDLARSSHQELKQKMSPKALRHRMEAKGYTDPEITRQLGYLHELAGRPIPV